ncbi:MAG: acyl-CoA-binding protein [Nonlabens sp.]
MSKKDVHKRFEAAVLKASQEEQHLVPPDKQLHLYAYYKRAIDEPYVNNRSFQPNDLRNAFKMNALIQVQAISKTQAMERYIEIIEEMYPKPW